MTRRVGLKLITLTDLIELFNMFKGVSGIPGDVPVTQDQKSHTQT